MTTVEAAPISRSDKRRIGFFLPSLDGGGAERASVMLANGIAARGYVVDMVLAEATGKFLCELDASVNVVNLGKGRVSRCVPGLAAYLHREKPAAMLSVMSHANVMALLAKAFIPGRTRLVLSEQQSVVGWGRAGIEILPTQKMSFREWAAGLKNRFMPLLMRLTYWRADAIVTVAEDMVPEFRHGHVVAIPNAVVDDGLLQRAAEPPAHPWLTEECPVILSVGRLEAQKDHETLIRAFSLIKSDARLIIIGEGAERPRLERLVNQLQLGERVSLPGFDPNPFASMKRARLFVLSSRHEGLPGVVIQAMACGCPVVSTDCPTGPREILEDGRWGDLVPVGDVAALAGAMERALSRRIHPDARRRAADFSIERAVDQYLEVLLPD